VGAGFGTTRSVNARTSHSGPSVTLSEAKPGLSVAKGNLGVC
jgi:hypothetical protein